MTRIFISMLPEGGNHPFVYNADDLRVVVSLDRGIKASDSWHFFLYSSTLMLIDNVETGERGRLQRSGRSLCAQLSTPTVWVPGDYMLLMRSGQGVVLRSDISIGAYGSVTAQPPRRCERMSADDVLCGRLCNKLAMWQCLSRRPGLRQLKQWAIGRCLESEVVALRAGHLAGELQRPANLLLATRCTEGWMGSTSTMLKTVTGITGEFVSVNCGEMYNPLSSADPYAKMREMFGQLHSSDNLFGISLPTASSFVFKYSHLSTLLEAGGKVVLKELLRHWPCDANSCFMIGTQQEIDAVLEQNPSLQCHFPQQNRLSEEPYTRDELIHLLFSETDIAHLTLTAEAKERACQMLAQAYDEGTVTQWTMDEMRQWVRKVLQPAYLSGTLQRCSKGTQTEGFHLVQAADVEAAPLPTRHSDFDEAMQTLDAMVGLNTLKGSLATLSNRMRFFSERRQMGLPTSDVATHHAIFTGNPGTGKTTVARLLGRIYHSLGLLSRGDVVCVDRSRMIGRYIGETEENMKQILQEARGNVLFVDEAYTLYRPGDERDYGRHALEALLDVLAQPSPDMLIIFAGYEREMDQLLSTNPGLPGRFPYRFRFPDYTAQELLQIGETILAHDSYELTAEARSLLQRLTSGAVTRRSEHFANARWMGQLVRNGIIPAMADRVATGSRIAGPQAYRLVEASDVEQAFERLMPQTPESRPRRAIGFCA